MQSILTIVLKSYKYILLLVNILLSSVMMAETVVLKSGSKIQGEIVLKNEDVVIIKKKDGTRFQYPQNEIQAILEDSFIDSSIDNNKQELSLHRAVAVRVQTYGGAVYLPNKGWGGQIGADLIVGTKQIGSTPIFVGGSVGFRTKLISEKNYTFIPLQAVVSMPLSTKSHAPYIGMTVGYGCSTSKTTKGGICLSASAGWTYQVNPNLALLLSASAEWQNTQTEIIESIDGEKYKNHMGGNFISIGATIGIQF